MRVLSDGARRLINEMKKLRLSLIFNEQGRARARARASERANADTMAVGSSGPPGPTSADLEISPLRVASRIYMRAAPSTGAPLARATRANKKFRPYPCVPASIFSPAREPSYGRRNTAGARGGSALLLFRPAIVKYKRLVRSADSSPPPLLAPLPSPLPPVLVLSETNISLSLPLTAEIFCTHDIAGCVWTLFILNGAFGVPAEGRWARRTLD